MSEFRDGDRVKVEFEATIQEVPEYGRRVLVSDAYAGTWVLPEHLTKLAPTLPTKEGSVIESHGHRFMLTRGGWHAASDFEAAWTNAELQDSIYAEDFTVVLEG